MRRSKLIFLIGLSFIATTTIYVIFRIITSFESIQISQSYITDVSIILFLLAEFFILIQSVGYFLNILRSITLYKRSEISYHDDEKHPAVDILIPVHDEPEEVLLKTIVAAQHIDYENYRIVILDNSSKEDAMQRVKALCEDRNVDYFAVPFPRHGAKAGAINEYLKLLRAPYIAVFDSDYRPSRDFLKLTVPQLETDSSLGFIQTPQFYGNLNEIAVSRAAQMQQSIFYEYICEGKSIQNAMIMCGTNLLIRTKALRSVGGFDESSVTEDFSTALSMIQKGWRTRYYNHTTAFGDGPRNLREFFRQQYRWGRGTLGKVLSLLPQLIFSKRFTRAQSLEFILSGSYYLIGLVWMILLIMPIVYLLFDIPSYMSDPVFYLWAYTPYFLFSMVLFFQTLFIRHYVPLDWIKTQSLTLLTVPVYARAAIDAIFNRKATFQKTNKDASPDEIPWDELGVQIVLIVLSVAAIVKGSIRWIVAGRWIDLAIPINIFWCGFHLFLLVYFIFYVYKRRGKKSSY